jgi:hypothetical protein
VVRLSNTFLTDLPSQKNIYYPFVTCKLKKVQNANASFFVYRVSLVRFHLWYALDTWLPLVLKVPILNESSTSIKSAPIASIKARSTYAKASYRLAAIALDLCYSISRLRHQIPPSTSRERLQVHLSQVHLPAVRCLACLRP